MYDEMLHGEFSSHGKHAAKAAVATVPVVTEPTAKHAVSEAAAVDADETGEVTEVAERPRGFRATAPPPSSAPAAWRAPRPGRSSAGWAATSRSRRRRHTRWPRHGTQDLPLAQAVNDATHSQEGSATGTSVVATRPTSPRRLA